MAATGPYPKIPNNRGFATVDISTAADGIGDFINLTGLTLSAIQMSTAWTDAGIGFRGCVDESTTTYPVYDTAGNFLTYQTSASRVVAFDPAVFAGLSKIQLVSQTTAGVAVAQAATRTIKLGLAPTVPKS